MTAFNVLPFPRQRISLSELIGMSRELLDAAMAGDWARAQQLQPLRRQRLEDFFADRDPSLSDAVVAEAIRNILSLDAQVTDLVQSQRQVLLQEAGRMRIGGRMQQSYLGAQA